MTLEVLVGESVGLVGESGSGKSTLARCLLGLEHPDEGTITIDSIDATRFEALSDADLRRARSAIQIVFQDPYSSLNPARSVGAILREALAMAAHRRHRRGSLGARSSA